MKTIKAIAITGLNLIVGLSLLAQENPDTSYWSHTGKAGITFSQVGFSNWAAGGDPSVSFNAILNYGLTYEREAHLWQTRLNAGYGAQRIGSSDESFKKTDDNIVLITRYGYRIAQKWYLSAVADFRTQFYDGYKYEEDTSIFVSAFMAPAYSKVGLGVTFNHKFSETETFSLTFSPINGKTTIVRDEDLSAAGAFGVDPGKKVSFKGGINLLTAFNKELIKNITLSTTLSLFTPYEDFRVMDVNWDMQIWFKINEFFSANITTQMIYDQDVSFYNDAGESYNSAVQFKEVLGIGLIYSF